MYEDKSQRRTSQRGRRRSYARSLSGSERSSLRNNNHSRRRYSSRSSSRDIPGAVGGTHHNALIQKHHKGENPMDSYELVRDWTLHSHTELKIVRRKDSTYDHQEYVLKYIRLGDTVDPHILRSIRNEIAAIRIMDHPHITGVFDVFEYSKTVVMVMEHHNDSGGPIWWKNAAHKHYSEEEATKLTSQILHIVKYMHDHKVVHGDLRPEAIVFETEIHDNHNVRLIDYGFHRFEGEEIRNFDDDDDFEESKYCHSPEALVRDDLTYASDVWSLGVIAYILLSGSLPFTSENELTSIWGNVIKIDFSGSVWDDVSDDAKDFIRRCLELDPHDRMTAAEALKHSWMKQQLERDENELVLNEDLLYGVAEHLVQFAKEPKLKRAALTMIAHKAHSPEVTELRSVFEHFDVDKDGTITRGELHTALRKLGSTNEQIMEIFDSLDFDADKAIEYTEFLGAVLEFYSDIKKDDLHDAFQRMAGDGNTCVTTRRLMSFFDVPLSVAQKMLSEVDDNDNGRISFDEFYHKFRQGSKSRELRAQREAKLREKEKALEKEKQRRMEAAAAREDPEQRRWRRMTEAIGGSKRDKEAVRQFLDSLGVESEEDLVAPKRNSSGKSMSIGNLRKTWQESHQRSSVSIPSEIETDGEEFHSEGESSQRKQRKKKSKRKSLKKDKSERSNKSGSKNGEKSLRETTDEERPISRSERKLKKKKSSRKGFKRTKSLRSSRSVRSDDISDISVSERQGHSSEELTQASSRRKQQHRMYHSARGFHIEPLDKGYNKRSKSTDDVLSEKHRKQSKRKSTSSSKSKKNLTSETKVGDSRNSVKTQPMTEEDAEKQVPATKDKTVATMAKRKKKKRKSKVDRRGSSKSGASEESSYSYSSTNDVKIDNDEVKHTDKTKRVEELLETAMQNFMSGKGTKAGVDLRTTSPNRPPMNPKPANRSRAELRAKSLMMGALKAQEKTDSGRNGVQSPSPIVGRPGQSPGALRKSKLLLDSLVYSHQVKQMKQQMKQQMADVPPEVAAIEAWNDYRSRVAESTLSPKPRSESPFAKMRRNESNGNKSQERGQRSDQVGALFSF